MHIWDLRTCTYVICGRAHMHIWDLRTCTCAICGLAHARFAEVQLFPRGCHVETIALPQIEYVQVRKSQMCMCARPQIEYVYVMTAVTYRATVAMFCFKTLASEMTFSIPAAHCSNQDGVHVLFLCVRLLLLRSENITQPFESNCY